jgi:hypothetical protein
MHRYGGIAVCVMIFYWIVIPDLTGRPLEGQLPRDATSDRDANRLKSVDDMNETSPLL